MFHHIHPNHIMTMSFNIRICTFLYHPSRELIYNITHLVFTVLQYHSFNLHNITISPISQIWRLPSPHSKDHVVPSHVHDNNITTTPSFMILYLWFGSRFFLQLKDSSLIINSILPLLPPLAWSSFCSRVLLLINSTSIIMSNCNFQNS